MSARTARPREREDGTRAGGTLESTVLAWPTSANQGSPQVRRFPDRPMKWKLSDEEDVRLPADPDAKHSDGVEADPVGTRMKTPARVKVQLG